MEPAPEDQSEVPGRKSNGFWVTLLWPTHTSPPGWIWLATAWRAGVAVFFGVGTVLSPGSVSLAFFSGSLAAWFAFKAIRTHRLLPTSKRYGE